MSQLFTDAQSFSNPFEGGTWGCEKIWEGVLYFCSLLHFYDPIFLSLLKGYLRCPFPLSSPPPGPLCASGCDFKNLTFLNHWGCRGNFRKFHFVKSVLFVLKSKQNYTCHCHWTCLPALSQPPGVHPCLKSSSLVTMWITSPFRTARIWL